MSQYPPQPPYPPYPQQPQPLPYGGYPPPNPRPTSVTVLAIIGIIFAALRILCTPIGLLPFLVPSAPNPIIDIYRGDPMLMAFLVVAGVLTFLLGVVLLVGSIGALGLKRWARPLLVRYAVLQIALELLAVMLQVALVMPKVSAALGAGPTASQAMAAMIGGIFGGLLALIVPVLLLIFMTRPHVVAAFENPAGAGYPSQY